MIPESYSKIINTLIAKPNEAQGTVIDINDPLSKSRVKVRIDGLTDQVPDADIPWYPVSQGTVNFQRRLPPVRSRVIVDITDVYNAVVVGAIPTSAT